MRFQRYSAPAFALLIAFVVGCGTTQPQQEAGPPVTAPPESAAPSPSVEQPLPLDPAVTHGVLDNGLAFYIRQHDEPQQRAELRLVINAGSVLEDDDQRGLAHFVEHMCFNGTENFAKQEIVDYLESIGMRFGADLNAYTSFDETVYMLQVPTDDEQIVEKGFQILAEWAHRVSFEAEEIDKERGVVIEEWRLGRGAQARIFDKQAPVLFQDSRYAERLIIGSEEVLESFLQYRTPLRFDDVMTVHLRLAAVTRATFQMAYLITADDGTSDTVRATGVTVHGCTTLEGRPTRLPAWLRELGEHLS